MAADVVINLPKLKTHKKAGVANALKNLVGINGNKEFLPHHRVGSAPGGGDCYPVSDYVKGAWETIADWRNMTPHRHCQSPGGGQHPTGTRDAPARRPRRRRRFVVGRHDRPANDLDLNRILLYGRADATLADHPQRRVLHVVDAVIAGQGDGPSAPLPLPLAAIMAGENALAIELGGRASALLSTRAGFHC